MRCLRLKLLLVIVFCVLNKFNEAYAQSDSKLNGHFNLGYWSVSQNTLDQNNAIQTDGVGEDFLQRNYQLLMLNLRLNHNKTIQHKNRENNFRFVARSRHNLSKTSNSLAYNQDLRYDISELSMQYKNLFSGHDFWLGRQIVFQSGGMRFDGARVVINLDNNQLGFFTGLGQDPRTSLGFIGTNQNNQILSTDFLSLGSYYQYEKDRLRFSTSLNTLLYQGNIDRLYTFTHGVYNPNKRTTISALLNYAFVPNSLDQLMIYFYYVFSDRLNNSLSLSRWSNIEYAASQSSQIPNLGQFTPGSYVNGDIFNDTFYTQIRDQISFSLTPSQNIFSGFEFTRRSFDDLDRSRYFLGYRNSSLLDPSVDLKTQINFINNYKSTHVAFDFLIGKDFADGTLRVESFFNRVRTERDVFLNNSLTTLPTENEQEFSFGGNAFWYFNQKNLVHARYQIFKEEDSLNDGDNITISELYLGTSFKF